MSGVKRCMSDQDPDYEDVAPRQAKRQRLYEEGAKEMTILRIESIIQKQFGQEKNNKEAEILLIDERLQQARVMADRLRACIVANFYTKAGPLSQSKGSSHSLPSIHPAVRKHIGKAPRDVLGTASGCAHDIKQEKTSSTTISTEGGSGGIEVKSGKQEEADLTSSCSQTSKQDENRTSRFKVKKRIIVGNVSKYIPVDKRENSDRSTHRWMVYVRGPRDEPNIDHFVDKVWFFLHPSYRPHDLVEIKERPFHLTRRGWGEFPVRVQLHFRDTRNKRVDIIHQLKLDRTYTGLQTLGSETVVDIELERDGVGLGEDEDMDTNTVTPPLLKILPSNNQTVNANPTQHQPTAAKTEPDLSIVKTEAVESEKVDTFNVVVKEEPMSPPRTVTPVKMVLGGIGSSPSRSATTTTTPVKEGAGWTRIQIKSEPNSPKSSPVTKKGWQNITMITSPGKSGTAGSEASTIVKTEPVKVSAKSTATPEAQKTKVQGSNLEISGRVSQVGSMGQIVILPQQMQATPVKSASPHQLKPSPAQLGGSQILSSQTTTSSSSLGTSAVQSSPKTSMTTQVSASNVLSSTVNAASKPSQPTVYIRCHDHHGKVYLIPQHALTKSTSPASAGATTVTTVQSASHPRSQVQRLSTPRGMAIIAPGASPTLQTGKSPAGIVSPQRAPNPRAVYPAGLKAQQSMTTSVKGSNKTATLTYVLASTAGTTTSQSLTKPGSQSQKLPLSLHPGVNQSIIISPQAQATGASHQVVTSQAGTSHSLPGTPVSKHTAATNPPSLRQISPSKKKAKTMTVGGNIVGATQKGTSFVLVNPTPGTPVSAKSGGQAQGGVSLLSGLAGLKTIGGKTKAISLDTSITRTLSSVSLLNKSITSPVRQLSPGSVVIKQEPKMSPMSAIRPGTVAVLAGQGNQHTPLLLVPAVPQIRPGIHQPTVVLATKGQHQQPQKQSKQSLITTVGNQKLIVQLVPPKQPQQANVDSGNEEVTQDRQDTMVTQISNKDASFKKTVQEHEDSNVSAFKSVFGKPILRGPDIQLFRFEGMEDLIRFIVRQHPLVKRGVDRSLYPYCAQTQEEYLSWNVGKRRAAEWLRVCTVQKMIRNILHDNRLDGVDEHGCQKDRYSLGNETIWGKKTIMWWARYHLYTPWDPELLGLLRPASAEEEKRTRTPDFISSYTDISSLLSCLEEEKSKKEEEKEKVDEIEDDDIDIISTEIIGQVKVKQEPKWEEVQEERRDKVFIEGRPEDGYIRDTAAQIGVRLEPVEVDDEESPGVHGHVVHDMIMSVTMNMVEDLLRKSQAFQLKDRRNKDVVTTLDIFKAIKSLPHCDFLTNSGLGIPSESEHQLDTPQSHPAA